MLCTLRDHDFFFVADGDLFEYELHDGLVLRHYGVWMVLEEAGQAGQPLHILLPVLVAQLARHTLYAAATRHTSDRSMTLRSSGKWQNGTLDFQYISFKSETGKA
jgi:hypothetical protein